jgi:[ribosomal protein S5]-alanine N-acetyltransferase
MRLETARLVLREFQESDFEAVHKYASDPEVVRYMDFGPNGEKDTLYFIQSQIQHQNEQPRRVFGLALVCKADAQLIGACSIVVANAQNREAFIGYILNKDYWNRGYVTEAAGEIIKFGVKELGLHRIYATCHPDNIGSYRVMEKVGMHREGLLREDKFVRGHWRDSLIYSILEQETNFR